MTRLTALRAENPIAWMAAAGLLRLLPGARLRWQDSTAELDYAGDPIADLAALVPGRADAAEFAFPHKLAAKMPPDAWARLREAPGDWALALASQVAAGKAAKEKGPRGKEREPPAEQDSSLAEAAPHALQPTQLRIRASDKYDMVGDARKIVTALAGHDIPGKITEALFGPWRYEDEECVAWGLDAGARIDAAAIDCKTEKAKKFGVLGAYWLGWEALPLFPCLHGKTRGWENGLRYPTWAEWLSGDDLPPLMLGLARMTAAECHALGLRLWHARFLRTHLSSGRLGWAAESARTPSDGKNAAGSRQSQAVDPLIV